MERTHDTSRRAALAARLPIAALLALAACGDAQPAKQPGAGPAPAAAPSNAAAPATAAPTAAAAAPGLPEGLVVRGPAQGTHVAAAKAAARQGEEITIVGRIGGSVNPFVADRAIFTIADPALVSCADMDDPDHCKTPWDYCCEDRAKMRAGTATIEVAGADGKPLAVALRGVQGLEPLATVAVSGTVVERNDAGLLVVRAKRIEVR
jgi:hypothetical protein